MTKRVLVTGAAGFIGSHLSERLVERGWHVTGLDNLCDTYSRKDKESNLAGIPSGMFDFVEADIAASALLEILGGVGVVAHLAAIPGVRSSWGRSFPDYARANIIGTERLLAACAESRVERLVYASSSSIYGDTDEIPMTEDALPSPVSPYGVSKLAGEHMCHAYERSSGMQVVSLRYFTVYGPRQRPDMAFRRFCESMVAERPIRVYGDGTQSRDFTFVDDAVNATVAAIEHDSAGGVYNIGGGTRISVLDSLDILSGIVGRKADVVFEEPQKGDVLRTEADTARARSVLGFAPGTSFENGLEREFMWVRDRSGMSGG